MAYQQFSAGTRRGIGPEYQKAMPEAKDVYWNDDFFDDEAEGTIAVFDFDYEQMEDYTFKVAVLSHLIHTPLIALYFAWFLPLYISLIVGGVLLLYIPLIKLQTQWQVRANHLAITQDGIRSVQDKRKSFLGFSMCDKGKHSKTVPFDKVSPCLRMMILTTQNGMVMLTPVYVSGRSRIATLSSRLEILAASSRKCYMW